MSSGTQADRQYDNDKEDTLRIAPEYPITTVGAMPKVGWLPCGFATFNYANFCFNTDNKIEYYIKQEYAFNISLRITIIYLYHIYSIRLYVSLIYIHDNLQRTKWANGIVIW